MTLISPWDGTWPDFDPADLLDEEEWLSLIESDRRNEGDDE